MQRAANRFAHMGGFIPRTSLAYSSWSSIAMADATNLTRHEQRVRGLARRDVEAERACVLRLPGQTTGGKPHQCGGFYVRRRARRRVPMEMDSAETIIG
jgi:hypothetical protein